MAVSNRPVNCVIQVLRRRRVMALVVLLAAALLASTSGFPSLPTAVASPPPGPTNPWLTRRVVGLAHSAGNDENPDETMYAFGQATKDGIAMLDLNVQITSDGVPVVMHNDSVDKTTNGTGSVSDMTFAQVHALDAAYWFTSTCWACTGRPASDYIYRGTRTGSVLPPAGYTADDFAIPSLEELFEKYPNAYMDIEIKDDGAQVSELAQKTAALIKQFSRESRTIVASFGQASLDEFRALAPTVATSATQNEVQAFFLSGTVPPNAQILDVPPTYTLGGVKITIVTPAFVQKAHAAGLAVWVWPNATQDENATFYGKLLDMGVDGINSSQPAILVNLLRGRGVAWDPNSPTTTTTSTPVVPPTTVPAPSTTVVPSTTVPAPSTTVASLTPTASPAAPVVASPTFTG